MLPSIDTNRAVAPAVTTQVRQQTAPAKPDASQSDSVALGSHDDAHVLAPGATLKKVAGGFGFAEGLTCDQKGNVFFTDQPNNRILKCDTEGQVSTFKEGAGRANGMSFDKQGNLIVCADEKDQLQSIAPDGTTKTLVDGYHEKLLNGPNDVFAMPDNKLYFTDPFYDRTYWDKDHHQQPQDSQQVYLMSGDHKTTTRVTSDLEKPNGIVGSPDGKTLYVADIGADKTYAYDVQPEGALTNKRQVAPKGSDGMTIDDHGNLYLSGNGVTVFNPDGKQIEHIDVPEDWVGNLAFGGEDKKTLYMAASHGLYSIRTENAGANQSK